MGVSVTQNLSQNWLYCCHLFNWTCEGQTPHDWTLNKDKRNFHTHTQKSTSLKDGLFLPVIIGIIHARLHILWEIFFFLWSHYHSISFHTHLHAVWPLKGWSRRHHPHLHSSSDTKRLKIGRILVPNRHPYDTHHYNALWASYKGKAI